MSARSWLKMFVVTVAAFGCCSVWGQINSWTNPTSGRWDDLFWSLGVRPTNTHVVTITNAGNKAIAIFPDTPVNFPATMTINSLVMRAPGGSANTLLQNYSGTANPLRVLNGCSIETGATLVNLYSKLQIDGTNGEGLRLQGGKLVAEGGTIVATNSPTVLETGDINVTNTSIALGDFRLGYYGGSMTQNGGTVTASTTTVYDATCNLVAGIRSGSLNIGFRYSDGHFNQSGGTNVAPSVVVAFGEFPWEPSEGDYRMSGGTLRCNTLEIGVGPDKQGEFAQAGGVVEAGEVRMGAFAENSRGQYWLTNGVLKSGQLTIRDQLEQFGGQNTTTSELLLQGFYFQDRYDTFLFPVQYRLYGGRLDSPGIAIDRYAHFDQSGGTNSVSGDLTLTHDLLYTLQGGFLCTSNTNIRNPGPFGEFFSYAFTQLGGTHWISNSLTLPGTYALLGGNLICSNLVLTGILTVSNGYASVTISNRANIYFGGWLRILGASHTFGVLHATNNAILEFGSNPATVSFLPSSGANWTPNSLLIVSNWNGPLAGGGGQRLVVGTSSSGLTPAQLSQVRFVNPQGFLAGSYPAQILASGEVVPVIRFNSWTSSVSGSWDSANWSAGTFPTANDSILITNAGSKAIAIQPSTPVNNPGSMTIHDLTIGAPAGSVNTLLLNFSGTANPLHILGSCLIQSNGILNNQFGAVQIDGADSALTVKGGLIQEGGSLLVTNGDVLLLGSTTTVNNATCVFKTLNCSNAVLHQTGGTITNTEYAWFNDGSRCVLSNGIFRGAARISASSFKQYGGTNYSDGYSLWLMDGSGYELTGGAFTGSAFIYADNSFALTNATLNGSLYVYGGNLRQQGGSVIAGQITLEYSGNYILHGGTVEVGYFLVNGTFTQTGGTIQNQVQSQFPFLLAQVGGTYQLNSGLLATPNLTVNGTFLQTAGTNAVTDTLSDYGIYVLNGGTLSASNLAIVTSIYYGPANLIISNTPIIINPGQFQLFGKVSLVGSTQQLGTLILTGDSVIDFTSTPGQLKFLNSSAAVWTYNTTLTISNWIGSVAGNGPARLRFGTNAAGLTTAQLSRIRFVNPAGLPAGTYYATTLSNGELIPTTRPYLVATQSGNSLIFTWSSPFALESTTNVTGPYALVPGAISPYVVNFSEPRRFFRLKQ